MSISRVQQMSAGLSYATFTSTPTAGNLMVVLWGADNATSAGETQGVNEAGWTEVVSRDLTGSGSRIKMFAKIAGAGESKTVTVVETNGGTFSYATIIIGEFSSTSGWGSLAGLTTDSAASAGTTTSLAVGSVNAANASDLVIAGVYPTGGSAGAWGGWSNGFTTMEWTGGGRGGYLFTGSAGTYTTTLTWATARYAGGVIAVFAPTVAATGCPKMTDHYARLRR